MYKIGTLGEIRLKRKPNSLFLILNVFLFITMIYLILLTLKISMLSIDSRLATLFNVNEDTIEHIFVGLISFSWVYSSYYSMLMTIKLEELKNEEYYPLITDKLYRFFQILYWLFGIWVIQPKINEYYNDLKKSPAHNIV